MADRISYIFLILSTVSVIFSCEINQKKIIENSSFLPRASGENREMIIEILFKNSQKKQALKEIKKLLEIKKEDSVFINNLKKKYNLK